MIFIFLRKKKSSEHIFLRIVFIFFKVLRLLISLVGQDLGEAEGDFLEALLGFAECDYLAFQDFQAEQFDHSFGRQLERFDLVSPTLFDKRIKPIANCYLFPFEIAFGVQFCAFLVFDLHFFALEVDDKFILQLVGHTIFP